MQNANIFWLVAGELLSFLVILMTIVIQRSKRTRQFKRTVKAAYQRSRLTHELLVIFVSVAQITHRRALFALQEVLLELEEEPAPQIDKLDHFMTLIEYYQQSGILKELPSPLSERLTILLKTSDSSPPSFFTWQKKFILSTKRIPIGATPAQLCPYWHYHLDY